MDIHEPIQWLGMAFEVAGVLVLALGTIVALVACVVALSRGRPRRREAYHRLRAGLERTILLSLEFLVAADIIRSVALEPTFASIGVLGLLVVIRTFLSWSLEVEIEGEWPWRRRREDHSTGMLGVDTRIPLEESSSASSDHLT